MSGVARVAAFTLRLSPARLAALTGRNSSQPVAAMMRSIARPRISDFFTALRAVLMGVRIIVLFLSSFGEHLRYQPHCPRT
jgi:hypothetical protein